MSVQFRISVESNGEQQVRGLTQELTNAGRETNRLTSALEGIGSAAFAVNNIQSALSGIGQEFNAAIQPGINFNSSLKDLEAITGVTGAALEKIGENARQNAIDFGGDATNSMRSYSLILSQLSPEIAKSDVALAAMGTTASQLSKQLGGDTAAATEILTTAMNQYGVSLDDPIAASGVMADMMNVMTAAAKEGSAELPQIKGALEQAGLMAKTANVSFEELNAAIQVLDKAGKKGAEGGVAIRNMLAEIGQGARMPKAAAAALDLYGISVDALGDNTKTFSQRLQLLKPIMNDTSAMTAIFGKENVAAAIALVQGTGEMDRLTTAVTGTNAGVEYAGVVMGSFSEKMARANAQFKDWGISLFNATEGFIPFITIGGQALMMTANLGGAVQAFGIIANTSFGAAVGRMVAGMGTLIVQGASMAVTYGAAAAMMVGGWVTSLISATAAQMGLNLAMDLNPIGLMVIGIAAVVGAIAGLIIYWDDLTGAIATFGKWIADHNPFNFLVNVMDNIFPGFKATMSALWDWVTEKFDMLFGWIGKAYDGIKSLFGFGEDAPASAVGEVAGMGNLSASEQKALVGNFTDKWEGVSTPTAAPANSATSVAIKTANKQPEKTSKKAGKDAANNISGGGNRPTQINVTIHKLQDQIVIQTTNLKMAGKEAGEQIVEQLLTQLYGAKAALDDRS